MRRVQERAAVLDHVAAETMVSRDRTTTIVQVLRDCVDDELARNHTIAVWPLCLGYNEDPVVRAFAEHYAQATGSQLEALATGNDEEVAAWLGLPLELYSQYPLVGYWSLFIEVLDRLEINEQVDLDNATDVKAVLDAWLLTFRGGRRYRMGRVGLERHLEDWLVQHLDALKDYGYEVALHQRQPVLPDGRRPDLLCRFVESSSLATKGDWLIVELKAGGGYVEAVEQLSGYVAVAREALAQPGQQVLGLLITDGASPKVRARIQEFKLGLISLASLGYRDHLAHFDRLDHPIVGRVNS